MGVSVVWQTSSPVEASKGKQDPRKRFNQGLGRRPAVWSITEV